MPPIFGVIPLGLWGWILRPTALHPHRFASPQRKLMTRIDLHSNLCFIVGGAALAVGGFETFLGFLRIHV